MPSAPSRSRSRFSSSPPRSPGARLLFDDLTRSGLVLTSRPVDLAMVAQLTPDDIEMRTVIREDASRHGRLQARISGLPAEGTSIHKLASTFIDSPLNLANIDSLTDAAAEALSGCQFLESADFRYCSQMTDAAKAHLAKCPRLRTATFTPEFSLR